MHTICFSRFAFAVQFPVEALGIKLNFNLIAHTTRLLIELALLLDQKKKQYYSVPIKMNINIGALQRRTGSRSCSI